MSLNGWVYKPGAAIVSHLGSEDDDMEISIIAHVYIVNRDITVFKATKQQITSYNRHYRAHVLTSTNTETFIRYNSLPLHIPLFPRKCRVLPHDTIVILPFYII